MASETYIFYDIPTAKGPECWSPNTWKGRAILNIKKVPYTTEWVEYPDIRVVLPKFGIPPLDSDPPYELPMLRIESTDSAGQKKTTCLRDSADILKHINEKFPEPAVDLDGPINQAFANLRNKPAFAGLVLAVVPQYLSKRSAEYFYRTREKSFGMTLAEYRQKQIDEGAWASMEAWAKEVRDLLRENGGPFFLGKDKLCLLDIRLLGLLNWAKFTGHREDYERIMSCGAPEFERFLEAAKPWSQVN